MEFAHHYSDKHARSIKIGALNGYKSKLFKAYNDLIESGKDDVYIRPSDVGIVVVDKKSYEEADYLTLTKDGYLKTKVGLHSIDILRIWRNTVYFDDGSHSSGSSISVEAQKLLGLYSGHI